MAKRKRARDLINQERGVPLAARSCPFCGGQKTIPVAPGIAGGPPKAARCPTCAGSGTVKTQLGERLALHWITEISKVRSAGSDVKAHGYLIETAPASIPDNLDPVAAQIWASLRATASGLVWAPTPEVALIFIREAAVWDGVPRPFTVTLSRVFTVEDTVAQRVNEIDLVKDDRAS